MKYGGGPQEDLLQYGLLVRLLTETTSTGQNANANQMAISDGIGGSAVGSVLTKYATSTVTSAAVSDGTTVTVTCDSTASLQEGQFVEFIGTTFNFTAGGVTVSALGKKYQIASITSATVFTFKATLPVATATIVVTSAYPYENAFGLVNTRQAQIQGIEGGFLAAKIGTTAIGVAPDDAWVQTYGSGLGLVPNDSVGVPGGMNPPTNPYTVRRYMVNFALGLFTQVLGLYQP